MLVKCADPEKENKPDPRGTGLRKDE